MSTHKPVLPILTFGPERDLPLSSAAPLSREGVEHVTILDFSSLAAMVDQATQDANGRPHKSVVFYGASHTQPEPGMTLPVVDVATTAAKQTIPPTFLDQVNAQLWGEPATLRELAMAMRMAREAPHQAHVDFRPYHQLSPGEQMLVNNDAERYETAVGKPSLTEATRIVMRRGTGVLPLQLPVPPTPKPRLNESKKPH